jgi:ligand-binding sensor domain-containing protein
MKNIILTVTLAISTTCGFGQNLYSEKFDNCKLSQFCLDCGDTKAQPPQSLIQELINNFDASTLKKARGQLEIQILIDSFGNPCLLSANNQTNAKSKKLGLQYAINNTSKWKPAVSENKNTPSSVSLILDFDNGNFTAKRRIFDFTNRTNEKSVGTPEIKGTTQNKLSETWTVYTQENSDLPWDMTRAVVNDLENKIWIGTDNGIVEINEGKWKIFNAQNTQLPATIYNKKLTQAVRDIEVDKKNNKWFVVGWDVYKYDNEKWTVYDSTNSPISWARKIFVDNANNIWFTSWDGVAKFDGKSWSVINQKNSELPTDKTLGVFVDSKNRVWIGTFEGNIMIDNEKTTKFTDNKSPLSKAYISQMYEDNKGNLWFDLYNEKGSDAGIYVLRIDGTWERITHKNQKVFSGNSVNNFLLDEDKNILWITLNNVGILRYDILKKDWEIYTNENSNVPSVNIEKITKDKDGAIWAATYAGVIRLDIK